MKCHFVELLSLAIWNFHKDIWIDNAGIIDLDSVFVASWRDCHGALHTFVFSQIMKNKIK